MKVIYFVSGISPPAGWGTEFIQKTAKLLAKKGVEITIVSPLFRNTKKDWQEWVKQMKESHNVAIVYSKAPKWIYNRLHFHVFLSPLFTTIEALKLFRKNNFDIVHEFSSTPTILIRSKIFKMIFGCKIVFTHSVFANNLLGKTFWYKLFNFADHYIVPSKSIISEMQKSGVNEERITYLLPGIDTKRFVVNKSKSTARNDLGIKTSDYVFSFFGSLTKEKGVIDILEAAKQIKRKGVSIYLFGLWKGSSKHELLKNKIKQYNLPFVHVVDKHVDIPTVLAASDCILLPQQTGHGVTIPPISTIETIVSGTYLIATNVAGNDEVVNSTNGVLIPSKDPKSLAKQMLNALKNNQSKSNVQNLSKYSIENHAQVVYGVYHVS